MGKTTGVKTKYIATLPVLVQSYQIVEKKINTSPADWVRISTAAVLRKINMHTLRNWIESGRVPVLILDGIHFLRISDLDDYLAWRKAKALSKDDDEDVA